MDIPKNELLRSTALAAIVAFALSCSSKSKEEETRSPDLPTSRLSDNQSDPRFQLYSEKWNTNEPASTGPSNTPPTEAGKSSDNNGDAKEGGDVHQKEGQKKDTEIITPGYKVSATLAEMPQVLRDRIVYGRETVDQLLALAGCVTQDFSLNEGKFATDNGVVEISVTAHNYPDDEQPQRTLAFDVEQSPQWTGNINQMRPQPIVNIATQACLNEKAKQAK